MSSATELILRELTYVRMKTKLFQPFKKPYAPKRKKNYINEIIIFVLSLYFIYYIYWNIELFSYKNAEYQFSKFQAQFEGYKRYTYNRSLKYILQWTLPDTVPFVYMGKGQEVFLKKNCTFKNCYVTANTSLLEKISMYDIVAFHGPELTRNLLYTVPVERANDQKYMFVSIESAQNYPICHTRFNYFFNLTWTYKLNSDLPYQYIVVKDKSGTIIGPNPVMHWIKVKDMKPISDELKGKLLTKSKAAAWFVSHCSGQTIDRVKLVNDVKVGLNMVGLDVDIYGDCGTLKCPKYNMTECYQKIQQDYFFYFAIENSLGEDYVTEKILHGLKNYAVPVVFGKANYTRFMPDGIYLNAAMMSPIRLAKQMFELMTNLDRYYDMFRWHNHYSFNSDVDFPETDPHCRLCAMANSDMMKNTTEYADFLRWWNEYKCFAKFETHENDTT